MTTTKEISTRYEKSVSLLKTQAILTIVFGSLGVLAAFGLVGLYIAANQYGVYMTEEERIEMFAYMIVMPVFLFITHVYFIISGSFLLKSPTPKVAKTLSIVNVVLGAMWNWVILIFAVLYVAVSRDYENGYKQAK